MNSNLSLHIKEDRHTLKSLIKLKMKLLQIEFLNNQILLENLNEVLNNEEETPNRLIKEVITHKHTQVQSIILENQLTRSIKIN